MSANIQINTNLAKDEIRITLKEITDLISVEHNKAMKTVEKLTLEASFGQVEKIATCITVGNGAIRDIDTYLLTKKQAIAVGAKLNNSLLMKLIDRLEQLENQNKPKTTLDLIIQSAQKMQELENIQQKQESRLIEVENKVENDITLTSAQKHHLRNLVTKQVYHLQNLHKLDNSFNKKNFQRIWKKLKDYFIVSSYMEIPKSKFDEACQIVNNISLGDLI